MKEIKFNNNKQKYSIIIGKNSLNQLSKRIKFLCPGTKKIALIIDKKVPKKFKKQILKSLKNYELISLSFNANEKAKSINSVNLLLNKLLKKNLNRSDLIIGIGGGITGDLSGFLKYI